MKLTFFSNFINHHQIPLAEEWYKALGDDYTFVATEPIPQERLNMGYADQNKSFPYVLTTYDSEENRKKAERLIEESDVVIVGSAPDLIMEKRLPLGKLTFHSSERYFKGGTGVKAFVRNFASSMKHIKRFEKYANYYYLCMSAYTAADVNTFANYEGRLFKWGYFPEVKKQDLSELLSLKQSNEKPLILWAGRLIDWKHPEQAIELAKSLKAQNYEFELNIIGNGTMEQELQERIQNSGLQDCVHLLGAMPPEKVRAHMEKADIFLFTSDFQEGWGAVLNESMNSGCAVVASHAIGSVPFLLQNDKNGLIYENGNQKQLEESVKILLQSAEKRRELGTNAYGTLANEWNATVGAERFLRLVQEIQKTGNCTEYKEGPCSKAENLGNRWYYNEK